jgi:hypothetical protein
MPSNIITVKTREEGFSIEAKYNPLGREGTFFFRGHIRESVNLENAFSLIRGAITDISKLTEGREAHEPE